MGAALYLIAGRVFGAAVVRRCIRVGCHVQAAPSVLVELW